MPRENINGEALSIDDFKIARGSKLREAKRKWNELDKSHKARFEV